MRIIKFFNHQILLLLFLIGVQYVFELMQIASKIDSIKQLIKAPKTKKVQSYKIIGAIRNNGKRIRLRVVRCRSRMALMSFLLYKKYTDTVFKVKTKYLYK